MANPRHYGPITCLCLDRKRCWIIVGTSTGVLSLWDRRFGLLLKSWKAGAVAASGKSLRIHQCIVHPTKGRGKWIMIALDTLSSDTDSTPTTLVEVWDIENGVQVETYTTQTASSSEPVPEPMAVTATEGETSAAAAIAALVASRQSVDGPTSPFSKRARPMSVDRVDNVFHPSPGVRAFVVGTDFGGHSSAHRLSAVDTAGEAGSSSRRGFMVTGSEDRKLRLWDLGRLESTAVLSGVEPDQDRPSYRFAFSLEQFVLLYLTKFLVPFAEPPTLHQPLLKHGQPPQIRAIVHHNECH